MTSVLLGAGFRIVEGEADTERDAPNLALEAVVVEVGALPEVDLRLPQLARRHPRVPLIGWSPEPTADLARLAFELGARAWVGGSEPGCIAEVADAVNGLSVVPPPPRAADPFGEFLPLVQSLTSRQLEVLGYIAVGMDNLKIAAHLGVGERTVKTHVTALYRKLRQENRAQLAVLGARAGVTSHRS